MCAIKKVLALLMVAALLCAVPVVTVSAEADFSAIIDPEIKNSITTEEATGNGLAFLINMNVQGATATAANEAVLDNATVTVGGDTYKVTAMGAVMTNQTPIIQQGAEALIRENVDEQRTVLDVPARYLWNYDADTCSFAVRIIKLPDAYTGKAIACRPYCVLEDAEGNATTVYGGMAVCSYNLKYYEVTSEETPALSLSVADVDDRIKVTSAAAEYCALAPATYVESFKVTLALQNASANAKTTAGDAVTYTFYDADGNALGTQKVVVDELNPGDVKTVEFYVPVATATIAATATDLHYVPTVTLPAIGSDIDVTKKKNRIRVSAASASFNDDGTIAVSLTFRNYTSNWITEERDYVQYTYYNAAGTAIKTETLYIGCIDTKKHPSRTFSITLPAEAASLQITRSQITYWTEWS